MGLGVKAYVELVVSLDLDIVFVAESIEKPLMKPAAVDDILTGKV